MFGKMGDMFSNFGLIQKLMKDENFRQLMMHPKFQSLFRDSSFQEALKSQDTHRINQHPKFIELMNDSELRALMSKLDTKSLFGK